MPLHDWARTTGWEGLHHYWLATLCSQVRQKLPPGYRAYIGSGPGMAIGSPSVKPDVAVRGRPNDHPAPADEDPTVPGTTTLEPDVEVVAVATTDPVPTILVERERRLVAAVEVISPRNKDRPSAREVNARRYAGYLLDGSHLMLLDVLPRPAGFSFAAEVEAELGVPPQPPLPPPFAAAYRVGEPVDGQGRFLPLWRRPLVVGRPLPTLPLPLTVHQSIPIDLESAYARAAAETYLD